MGRPWPILTGERGHYELAAGRDPMPFITTLEKFANAGGMISGQLWDAADLPARKLKRGGPTGASMPLCWSHAEYISLVRSAHDGVCFDRIEPAYQRYVVHPVRHQHEMWSTHHPIRHMADGHTLRLILEADAAILWTTDGWVSSHDSDSTPVSVLRISNADLPTHGCPAGNCIEFTFFWKGTQQWEGRNYAVTVLPLRTS